MLQLNAISIVFKATRVLISRYDMAKAKQHTALRKLNEDSENFLRCRINVCRVLTKKYDFPQQQFMLRGQKHDIGRFFRNDLQCHISIRRDTLVEKHMKESVRYSLT